MITEDRLTEVATMLDDASGMDVSFAEELMWQAELGGQSVVPFFDCGRSLWLVLQLQGPLNQEALRVGLQAIVERHHVLRSRFVVRNGQPRRMISQLPLFGLAFIERQSRETKDHNEVIENEIKLLLERRLDLACGSLLQAALVALNHREHILAIAVHHIVFDRWSMRLLESELGRFYCAYVTGAETGIRPLSVQYQDYVLWQRKQLNSERASSLGNYWTNKLGGLTDLVLPGDKVCGPMISTQSGSSWFAIPAEEVGRLVVLSRQFRTTMAATMLAVFTLFLYRLSGMDDFVVGIPLSDRRRPEFEELIGLFMNVVVARISILSKMTFLELLDHVRRTLVDACLHQDLPYGYLQRTIPTRPPYRVVFNFMPKLLDSSVELTGLQAKPLSVPMELQSLADLSLHLRHEAGTLLCRLVYKADLFSEDCGRRFATQIQTLTTAVLQAPQNCIDTYQWG